MLRAAGVWTLLARAATDLDIQQHADVRRGGRREEQEVLCYLIFFFNVAMSSARGAERGMCMFFFRGVGGGVVSHRVRCPKRGEHRRCAALRRGVHRD
eukprot:448714-Rhodomonas_salina.1